MNFSTSTQESSKLVFHFFYISSFVSFELCIYVQYVFDSNRKCLLELIKRKLKVHQKNMSREGGQILTNEKHFLRYISQLGFCYGLLTKLLRIIDVCHSLPSPFKLKRGILPSSTKQVF